MISWNFRRIIQKFILTASEKSGAVFLFANYHNCGKINEVCLFVGRKSGIILSSNSKLKSQIATVVSVGPGAVINGVRTIMEVKENDNVFVEKGVGIEIEHEGIGYVVVTQSDILAVIR